MYRYAIPFTEPGPGLFPVFSVWLRPGAAGPPRRVIQVAAGTAGVHLVSITPGVASRRLDLSSGQQLRVVTRAGYGGQRFCAFVLPPGTGVVGWTAYGPAGKVLGSGPGATAG